MTEGHLAGGMVAPAQASATPSSAGGRQRFVAVPLRGALAYPAAVLCGALYFLAFPGMDIWPLSFVALVPLIIALKGQTARRGLALGWTAGFTMTMLGFYWLVDMLKIFSGFPTALCVLFMAILCAYQAGRIALLGWLCARAERRGWPLWLTFGLAFPASELLFPLLFPWYYAATVHQIPVLLQWAEWGGPIAVGLALVATNLAVAEALLAVLEGRRPAPKLLAGLLAFPLLALVYGLIRIPMVESQLKKAETVRVALVQANMSLMGKRLNPDEALKRHLSLTRGAMQAAPVDLVVWSETSIGGAVDERAADAFYQQRVGRELPVPTIFGAVLRREVDDVRKYVLSNSALVTDKSGKVSGRYDKQFLLAFGEYLPLGETFPVLYEWSPHSGRFSPGESFEPLPVGDHRVATFICYEDIIPSFVNRIMDSGSPELLVNLTNDAWFGDTTQPWIHLALSKLRAIEQRRFFVRSTNSGVSAFVDPVGRTLAHTPTFSEVAIAQDLKWLKLSTPYQVLGDVPWWLVAIGSLGLAFLRRPQPPNRPGSRASHPGAGGRTSVVPSSSPAPILDPTAVSPQIQPQQPTADLSPPVDPSPKGSENTATAPIAPPVGGPGPSVPKVDPHEFGAFPKPPTDEPKPE